MRGMPPGHPKKTCRGMRTARIGEAVKEKDRKQTEKERAEVFAKHCAALEAQGFEPRDRSMSMSAANICGTLAALPFIAAAVLAFVFGGQSVRNAVSLSADVAVFAAMTVVSIIVHECLHALFWAVFNGGRVRLGFSARTFTPYCVSLKPMGKAAYFIGIIAPFVFLGVGFFVAACLTGYWILCAAGAANILMAGADLLVAARLVFSRGKYFVDHPSRCGFVSFSGTAGAAK